MTDKVIHIAMITRPNLFSVAGGDTIQVIKTAAFLEKSYPVKVDIVLNGTLETNKYDLLHFFNIICPEDILGFVLKHNIPYVVSTIYVDYREFDRYHRTDLLGLLSRFFSRDGTEYLKNLAKLIIRGDKVSTYRYFLYGQRNSIQYILKHARMLLPNSLNEYKRLANDYNIEKEYTVVPNAIDPALFNPDPTPVERDLVICVGRIEGNKNQLNVIRALKDSDYKLVFIGAHAPNQMGYYNQCLSEATGNITFIDHIPQEELKKYYSSAKVHILASWFETTGLSSLEAGAMGCNLVIGNRGDVKDYFGEDVFYCEPGNLPSIRDAVDKAWNTAHNDKLQTRILQSYTWEKAAQVTAEAYQKTMNKELNA